ncbi:MAG: PQQ-binding-like beta-propeller repeat protein [Gemmataceae bacterium]
MRQLWAHRLPHAAQGLSLARETGGLLLAESHHLARYDPNGRPVVRARLPGPIAAASQSDDGQTIIAVGHRGQVWRLTPDLVVLWERTLPQRLTALAVDVLGARIAVADATGGLHVLDREGRDCWAKPAPTPLVHLAFIPEAPLLLASAQYGLVCAFDATGHMLWRDGLVAHVGALTLTGDGGRVLLPCFTEGLFSYEAATGKRTHLPRAAPSRLAAIDYRGQTILTAGLGHELARRSADGAVCSVLLFSSNLIALAVGALGNDAFALLEDGTLIGIEILHQSQS